MICKIADLIAEIPTADCLAFRCQDYLWDGIKRDRIVWMGDMHPETSVLLAVFGETEILPRSLDQAAATTPPDSWMNLIDSYTSWYFRNMYEWYRFTGDTAFLQARNNRRGYH
jgi:hypothetical protein